MDFRSASFRDDPWPVYAQFRRTAPVWWSPQLRMYCVFTHQAAREALTGRSFTVRYPFRISRQVLGETLLDIDGPQHRRLRKTLARFLTGRLGSPGFTAAVDEAVGQILDDLSGQRRFDFVDRVAARLPMLTTAAFLGVPSDECPEIRGRLDYLLRHLDGSDEEFSRVDQVRGEVEDRVRALMHRATPRTPGMIAQLRRWQTDGELTERECLGLVMLTLAAGVETSTGLLSNAMVCLARHPQWIDAARRDPDVLPGVVREVARWEPPQHDTVRFAAEATELAGVAIPQGSALKIFVASANRDENAYASPERFDPGRTETSMLSFGHGLHSCLGTHMAYSVAHRLLAAFLRRFEGFSYADEPLPAITGGTFRRPRFLHIEPTRLPATAARGG